MIKRVNLIEKKAFSFTYLQLLRICMIVILLNVLIVGYQFYQTKRLDKKVKKENIALQKLEAQRNTLTKRPVKKKVSVGQYQDLLDRIENTPRWSRLLDEVSQNLPNTVWITTFQSESTAKSAQTQKKGKGSKSVKDQKKQSQKTARIIIKHSMEVNGLGSDMRNITEFTTNLSKSSYFKNLTLAEAVQQSFGISFKIQSDIRTDVR